MCILTPYKKTLSSQGHYISPQDALVSFLKICSKAPPKRRIYYFTKSQKIKGKKGFLLCLPEADQPLS